MRLSNDSIHFKPEQTQLGFDLIPRQYPACDPARVKEVYSGDPKFERRKSSISTVASLIFLRLPARTSRTASVR
jgi:hypothetical protein